MKLIKIVLIIILCLTFALLMAACANNTETPKNNSTSEPDLSGKETPQSEIEFLFPEPYPDSDTLARDIFDPAIELYRLFDGLGDLKHEWESAFTMDVGEHQYNYFLVTDERYPTFQSFINDLRNHFSEEFVQHLLSNEDYIEHDGLFYTAHGARGADIGFHDVNYEIISQSADKIIFRATVRYKDSALFELTEEEWDAINWDEMEFVIKEILYTYEKINDNWVFTEFRLFY